MREFNLLKHVYAANPQLAANIIIPPGDDMGMVDVRGCRILAAVDQLVAGRHFDPDRTPLELVGRKAVTRSLSDIAAMAARPVASLVAVVLPPEFAEENASALFDAMRAAAQMYECPLIGGDIAFHAGSGHPLTCSTTVLATPLGPDLQPRRRSAAKAGDGVYVTGAIGGAINRDGLGTHLTFEPRIREAIAIYEQLRDRLHAMIDISDGLGRDLGHIAADSGFSIDVDGSRIPCNEGIEPRQAISTGEDYELAFTAAGDVPASIAGLPITRIGSVTAADDASPAGAVRARFGGEVLDISQLGWEHHAP